MPVAHAFEGNGLARVVATGDVTIDEIIAATRDVWTDPRFMPPTRVLWDFRGGRMVLSTSEVKWLGEFLQSDRPEGRGRAAIVVADDLSFGLSRMTDLLMSDDVPLEVRPFRDFDEALSWLAEDF